MDLLFRYPAPPPLPVSVGVCEGGRPLWFLWQKNQGIPPYFPLEKKVGTPCAVALYQWGGGGYIYF